MSTRTQPEQLLAQDLEMPPRITRKSSGCKSPRFLSVAEWNGRASELVGRPNPAVDFFAK